MIPFLLPRYVASDLHIGYNGGDVQYDTVIDFLHMAQTYAKSLVLCGDILDLWTCTLREIQTEEPYATAYNELVKTASVVPTQIVWGNHDYNLAGQVPLNVTDEFYQKGVLYCHGWRMDVEQCLAYPMYAAIVREFPWIYQRFFRKPVMDNGEGDPRHADVIHKVAVEYAHRKNVTVVMGHTHCDGVFENVYDCGRFGANYVEIDTGGIKLKQL